MLNGWSVRITYVLRKQSDTYYNYEMHTFTSSYVRANNDVLTFHVPYLSSLSRLSGTADVS